MNYIKFSRTLEAIRREAARHGCRGDALAKYDEIPICGTFNQQMQIATIRADIRTGGLSTRDGEMVDRLVRGAVLTGGPADDVFAPVLNTSPKPARRRAW